MKKIHLLPNLLTALGLICGLFVIFKLNMTPFGEVNEWSLITAAALLLLAAFFDLLDGAVARAMKAESDFGSLFDSLADAISFGVAPSVIILKSLSLAPGTFSSYVITTGAMLFSVCGVMRLVRFNVEAMRISEAEHALQSKNFTGLPIPGAAAAAVSLNLFLLSEDFHRFFSLSEDLHLFILASSLILLGYLMISRWKFPSAKTLRFRVKTFQVIFGVVVSSAIFFWCLVYHFPLLFVLLSWGYILLALILGFIRMLSGRKSKTLEDFEPEPDDFIIESH